MSEQDFDLIRAKGKCFRDILKSWSEYELQEALSTAGLDPIDLLIENDVFSTVEQDEIMKRPEYQKLRKKNLLSDDLEIIRLCGGAKTPEEEHDLYLKALGKTA